MIPMLPPPAKKILATIEGAGGQGYVVGGALRDLLRSHPPKDWDFATTLTPDTLLNIFPNSKLIGGSCGTVQVPFGASVCEITPCRTESDYSDRRHPDTVQFIPNILEDLSRRDFTVNAMAYNGEILIDPFGGQADMKAKKLRCVGSASERFAQDPLRILRLFRFAAELGYTADWPTFCAASDAIHTISSLPKERVLAELQRILLSPGPQLLSGVIAKGGLHAYGLSFAPSLAALANVPRISVCRWWALMALCGADTANTGEALGFSKRQLKELDNYTALYRCGPAKNNIELKQKLQNKAVNYAPIAATFTAVSPAFAAEPSLFAAVCAGKEPYRLQHLAVNGAMLQAEGIKGKRCGLVLNELLGVVIKNPALNKRHVLLGLARALQQIL